VSTHSLGVPPLPLVSVMHRRQTAPAIQIPLRVAPQRHHHTHPHLHLIHTHPVGLTQSKVLTKPHTGMEKPDPSTATEGSKPCNTKCRRLGGLNRIDPKYVCMYVKIRRHQHTRVHAHTGPRRHARAPACHRHHIPRLVRRQAFHTDHHM